MQSVLWVKHCLAQWYLVTQSWVEAPLLEERSLGTWRSCAWENRGKSKPTNSGIEAGQEGRQANEIRRHGLGVLQENQKV